MTGELEPRYFPSSLRHHSVPHQRAERLFCLMQPNYKHYDDDNSFKILNGISAHSWNKHIYPIFFPLNLLLTCHVFGSPRYRSISALGGRADGIRRLRPDKEVKSVVWSYKAS